MSVRFGKAGLALGIVAGMAAGAWAQQEPAKSSSSSTGATTRASDPSDPFDQPNDASTRSRTSPGDSTSSSAPRLQKATFGAGCFWHVEAEFEWLPGVVSAVSGYAGGRVSNPSYEMVHEGDTGHIEVVQVTYDPSVVSYEQLLRVFWHGHDPTQWNRQGPDVGTQYRSAIFYHNEEQRKAALKSYRELTAAGAYRAPIVTLLLPMKAFYRAEEYHQNYYGGKPDPSVVRRPRTKRSRGVAKRPATAAAKVASKPAEKTDPKSVRGAAPAPVSSDAREP